jgi:hypothetical protein
VAVPLEAAVAVLERAPESIVGSELGAPWTGPGAHSELGVELPGGRYVARQVRIGLGRILEDEDALALPLWWQDAEHPQLFPTFDGGLELRRAGDATELRLIGSYQPPLGVVGRFGDGLLGRRLVMASLERFLTAAAARLTAEATSARPSR